MIHPTAIVESDSVGENSNIWAYAHVMRDAILGNQVNVGDHCFIESGARIGNKVTIKNAVLIFEGITIEDDVFIGPRVCFTNDRYPRSPRMERVQTHYSSRENWLEETVVRRGCSIGAGAIICPGIELGEYSTISAGAVVTRDVAAFSLVAGNPAKPIGDVCRCGQRLGGPFDIAICDRCGEVPEERRQSRASTQMT